MTSIAIDLANPEYKLNPFPTYRILRDEAPVNFVPQGTFDGQDYYVLSRWEDVAMVLRDRSRFSSHINRGGVTDIPMLVNRDAPEHTRLRRITNRAFAAKMVRSMADWVDEVVRELVDDILAAERVEFVEQFTTALPLRVVGDMLGIPLDRKADLRRWSQAVMNAFSVAAGMDPAHVPGYFEDILEFGNYMSELANARRDEPPREDILGELVRQQGEGVLTRDELATMAWSFVAAGHETTMNLLGGGVHLLLTDQAVRERMLSEPERTGDFIEEYLRLYSPTQWVLRRVGDEPVELHGVTIPAGALLHIVLGSANRDPRQFEEPDVFDIDRPNLGDQLAFGAGSHFCPGTALSRLLATSAFTTMYPLLERLSLDPQDPPRLRERQGSYGLAHFPLVISKG